MTALTDAEYAENIRDRLIRQLIAVNEQLEQFAYIASHDLREPLRIIVCFTDLLEMEYGDRLDETGKNYMAITRKAAKKMEALVSDLLEFGRLGKNDELFVESDCNEILQQVLETLQEKMQSTQASIANDSLPVLTTNPLRFARLLQNLIGNALKYHSPARKPQLAIRVEDQQDCWRFSIADNGIGIKSDYLESIFAPFKRLHGDHEYAGTGIGLAICKRIVEGFDGKIWAESAVDQGSVFFFTIPKRADSGGGKNDGL